MIILADHTKQKKTISINIKYLKFYKQYIYFLQDAFREKNRGNMFINKNQELCTL